MSKKETTQSRSFWGLRAVALTLAIALELYFFRPELNVTMIIPANVELIGLPQNLTITEPDYRQLPWQVELELSGPRQLVEQIKAGDITVPIIYPKDKPREFIGIIDKQNIKLPIGVELNDINPDFFNIKVDELVGRQIPVKVITLGEMPIGYLLKSMEVSPTYVVARGSRSAIGGLEYISTSGINLAEVKKSESKEVSLEFLPGVTFGVTLATVRFDVEVEIATKKLSAVSVQAKAPNGFAASVQPPRVDVVLSGPILELESISNENFILQADGTKLAAGNHSVVPTAILPNGVSILSSNPQTVTLFLKD